MKTLLAIIVLLTIQVSYAEKTPVDDSGESAQLEETSEKKAGEKAQKYFKKSKKKEDKEESGSVLGTQSEHYLAIHLGSFITSETYKWGETAPPKENHGSWNIGFTYRFSQVSSLADWVLRGDFLKFDFEPDGSPLLFDVVPMLMFPDATSQFPVYFGLGVGPGFFFKQLKAESFLALSYQLIVGVRLFNVVQATGFFLEGGMKNHVHLLSDGQFNGYYVALGTLFSF